MSIISKETKKKLTSLLYSDDFVDVLQGIELLEALAEDEHDLYFVLNLYYNIPKNQVDLYDYIKDVKHRNYIATWILGALMGYGVEWITRIIRLKLRFLQLQHLPDSIGNFTQIKKLDLCANNLTTLPQSLLECTRLARLDLTQNKCTTISEDICKLTTLTSLVLARNEITSIPDSIKKLTQLDHLDASGNKLTEFGFEILTQLTSLNLSSNQIQTLSPSMNIRSIDLRYNKLSELSEEQFESFFQTLVTIPNLKDIELKGNNLNKKHKLRLHSIFGKKVHY